MSDTTPELAPASPEPAGTDERAVQIALVDDDRNIPTTVSIALQAEGFATRLYSDGETRVEGAGRKIRPTLPCSTSRCPRWTEWSCSDGCANIRRCRLSLLTKQE